MDKPESLPDKLGFTEQIAQTYQADLYWWQAYENPDLNKLVDTALTRNPDYIKAALTVRKELYALNISRADLFPTFWGQLGASSQRRIDRHESFSKSFSGEMGLNYEIDLYGKVRDEVQAQAFEYSASVMDKDAARLTLINSVVDLYFNLVYLHESIELTQKNIKAYENIRDITKRKYTGGKADNLEYLQSKGSVLTEQTTLLNLKVQFKEMETSLRNILGLNADEELTLSYSDLMKQKQLGVNMDVPTAVLALRPDLKASQARLEKAFVSLSSEQKNWYPTVSLKGTLGSNATQAHKTFDFPYILGSVSIDLPFLDWTRVKNNIKISETDYKIAAVEFKDTLAQALNEVAYYYFAYSQSLDIFEHVRENYANAVKITQYYESRYHLGKAEFTDFLEAVNTENSLRKDLILQKYQIIKYENYIYKAMGGRYEP